MRTVRRTHLLLVLIVAVPLGACTVDVRNEESGGKAEVDVRTPVGDVSVRTDVDASDTGLAVYPGARPLQNDDDQPGSANVTVGGRWFGVNVLAANFETEDGPDKVVEFYRNEMKAHGDVVACRGDIDFRGGQLVCREDESARDVQLAVGTEQRHRIVAVKPRGSGSEFALVYIQTG
jgi:hypothetical protein